MMHSLELYRLRTVRESIAMNCRTKPYSMANKCRNPCHRKKEKENQKNSSNSFEKYLPQFFFSRDISSEKKIIQNTKNKNQRNKEFPPYKNIDSNVRYSRKNIYRRKFSEKVRKSIHNIVAYRINSPFNTHLSPSVIFTRMISPIWISGLWGMNTSLKFLVLPTSVSSFHSHDMRISSSRPTMRRFRAFTVSRRISLRIVQRRAFSSGDISSSNLLVAVVPVRAEYRAMNAKSNWHSRIAVAVIWNSSSVSPGNPTMISVEIEKSGSWDLR